MRDLKTIFAALLAALVSIPASAAPAPPSLVTPFFLLPYSATDPVYDYRPAINASGTRFVFERTFPEKSGTTPPNAVAPGYQAEINLYITDINSTALPQRLVTTSIGTNRPDWCWFKTNPGVDGPIVFSTDTGGSLVGIYYTMAQPQPGGPFWSVTGTTSSMIYPTWFPGCARIAVDVTTAITYQGQVGPQTQKFDLYGNNLGSLSGSKLWAGFPSVNPVTPRLVALAAQQFGVSSTGYTENLNYVYIANNAGDPPRVTPLDQRAPTNRYVAKFEGRTPSWSPDGRWIAFESDRNCPVSSSPLFAIFLQDGEGRRPARQVTDCSYNAQHAKWYSQPINGRTLLIVSARPNPGSTGPDAVKYAMGIATLDITAFVQRP